jgi:hypothetical protein
LNANLLAQTFNVKNVQQELIYQLHLLVYHAHMAVMYVLVKLPAQLAKEIYLLQSINNVNVQRVA